ncbi:MAG: chitobiase/beta-hexosaminidase C-terminal domain-containing protein [Lachnospiraceae bacterium]|nr:chitobiase/beta-hexosaminidase C-terminal domain-containing protein [Lachnospiraceae bacterium]
MKKVLKKFNRTLSIMLAAAMVLTMVPQTAMPVLAAEEEIEATAEETPEVVDEDTADDAEESTETEDVVDADEADNSGDSDTTEGETNPEEGDASEEITDDNDTPVIDPADDVEEDPVEEPTEEEVVEPTTEDSTNTVNEAEAPLADLAAPVITLKRGDDPLTTGAHVLNRTNNVSFEITAVDGVSFYYTLDGTEPAKTSTSYASAVTLTAPDVDTETTVTIKAIAVVAATEDGGADQTSTVASATVIFDAKKNTVKLDSTSESDVTIKAGTEAITADAGIALDPANDLALTVEIGEEAAKTKEVDKVEYKSTAEGAQWKEATLAANGTYTIPKADLTTDILVKATLKLMPVVTFAVSEGSSYDMFTVKLTVKKGSATLKNAETLELTADNNKVSIPSGTVVTAAVAANTKCQLTKVTLGDQDVTISNKTKATVNVSTASALLSGNQTVTVTAIEEYLKAKITAKSDGSELKDSPAKTWSVAPRNSYTISAVKGGGGAFAIGKAELVAAVDGIKLTQDTEEQNGGEEGGEGTRAAVPTGTYTLEADATAGGKTAKVKLYATEEDTTPVDTITIKVAPVITKVTVAGAKNDTISQVIGTEASYALTLVAAEKASTDTLGVKELTEADKACIESAEIKDGKLVIKTKAVAAKENAAEISIVNLSDVASEKPVMATVKVNTTKPAWDSKAAPTVKLAGATDIELKLDMTLPKGASATPAEGTKYYYEVTTTAVNPKTDVGYTADKTPRYYEVTGNATTTRETVKVIAAEFGKGTDTKFNVDVKLLQYAQTSGSTTPEQPTPPEGGGETGGGDNTGGGGSETASYTGASVNAAEDGDGTGDGSGEGAPSAPDTSDSHTTAPTGTLIASSKAVTVRNLATKAPYYAEKITLKKEKAASGLYTGQTAAVATIDFGKNATYTRDEDVEVEVLGAQQGKLTAVITGGKVILTADEELNPGKYTIRVSQTEGSGIPKEAVPASATLQVTVVQGIYSIAAISVPTIYVAANKAGTAKITPVYNDDDGDDVTDAKPKTAKVVYTVGKVDENGKFVTDADIAKKVAVKSNGTVTVLKGYEKAPIAGNKFAVQVKAADFADNEEAAVAEFEIVTTAQELGDIVLVKPNNDTSTYAKMAVTAPIAVNEIVNGAAEIRVLKTDVTKTDNFAETDFVEAGYYTLSFSKKNDIGVDVYGDIWVKKPVDKVKVSAVTTDGGKKKATDLTFSVTYETVEGVKLQITSPAGVSFTADNKAEVTVPTGETIKVKAVDANGKDIDGKLVDYKLTAGTGAKIVTGAGSLDVGIVMNKKDAILKLTNPKGSSPKEVVYTISNANFEKAAAPKVTVKKGAKLYASNSNTQKLTFTIAKANLSDAKKIKISAAADGVSQYLLGQITDADKEISLGDKVISTNTTVDFDVNFAANLDVIKKATLYFDFYGTETTDDGSTKDVLLTKTSAAVTVKTELLKKSFKLTNKYTMSAKDTAKVALTGKETGVDKVEYTNILNANIKGTVNKFKEAFELDAQNGKLCLVKPDLAVKTKEMNNLIGFVKYTVTYADGSTENFITQLTITVKPSVRKLTSTKATVVVEANMAPTVTVMAGKTPCELAYAEYTDAEGKFVIDTGKSYEGGVVTFKLADGVDVIKDLTLGKKTGTLTVIPSDSSYITEWEELNKDNNGGAGDNSRATDADKAAFLKDYGIAVPVTIELKSIDTRNKVKVETKNKNVNFSTATEDNGTFTAKVPFTVLIQAVGFGVTTDRTEKKGVPVTPSWITFSKVADENAILVTIDKARYATAVKEGGKTGEKYKLNGKAVKGTALIKLSSGNGATDSVILNITPPTLSAADIENATPAPGEVEITVTVSPATASVEAGKTQQFSAVVKVNNAEDGSATVIWSVAAKDTSKTPASGTKFNANGNDADTLTVDATESETLVVTATYTKDGKNYTGTAEVTVTQPSSGS